MKSFKQRMASLEAARWARLTPLERAYELADRHTPPEQWPDAELNAYCATLPPEIRNMSDAELEALIEQAI